MADTILNGRSAHGSRAARYTLSDYFLVLKLPSKLVKIINGEGSDATSYSLSRNDNFDIINGLTDDSGLALNSQTTLLLGGEDSYVGSISFQYKTNAWEVTGDPTGSWVHTKNRDRTGTCNLSMNQVAYKGALLIKIFNIYYKDTDSDLLEGFDIYVTDRQGRKLMSACDCYVQTVPSMEYGSTPRDLSWTFNCGRITYEDTI